MSDFKVERVQDRKRYTSQPGDLRRSGRAAPAEPRTGQAAAIALEFVETGATVEARLGVVTVARITINPNGGFLWAIDLSMVSPSPRSAADLEKAKGAIDYKVREWCEAARLMPARTKGGAQ